MLEESGFASRREKGLFGAYLRISNRSGTRSPATSLFERSCGVKFILVKGGVTLEIGIISYTLLIAVRRKILFDQTEKKR